MQKLNDNDLFTWGKFKGTKLCNVPPDFLLWLLENNKCYGALKNYIMENLDVIKSQVAYSQKQVNKPNTHHFNN